MIATRKPIPGCRTPGGSGPCLAECHEAGVCSAPSGQCLFANRPDGTGCSEVQQTTERISKIVQAMKAYTYLDQAPLLEVDVHEGLENTLIIMQHKLKKGLTVRREYAPDLPRIEAYASELIQVWTNIIDNAVDAMDGKGEIILRTYQDDRHVVVEFVDNGPGIPEEIQSRIYEPFFTTKPPGKGTGLGLHISHDIIANRHHGQLLVESKPGMTKFQVVLPIHMRGEGTMSNNSDETMRTILTTANTIACVGVSSSQEKIRYGGEAYRALKARYDPDRKFPDLNDKVVRHA